MKDKITYWKRVEITTIPLTAKNYWYDYLLFPVGLLLIPVGLVLYGGIKMKRFFIVLVLNLIFDY